MPMSHLNLEAILEVDGGEAFEQLGGSQHVRCHEHIDVGIETVNRGCLGKHTDTWHAERELQSNLQVQRRELLRSSEDVKLSYNELQSADRPKQHPRGNGPHALQQCLSNWRGRQLQSAEADVVQRFVIQQHAPVHALNELWLHYRVRHFG